MENEKYILDAKQNEFFQPGYVNRVIDLLPKYIPDNFKAYLKTENPDLELVKDISDLKLEKQEEFTLGDDDWTEGKEKEFSYLSIGSEYLAESLITHLTLTSLRENGIDIKKSFGHEEDLELLESCLDEEVIQILEIAFLSGDIQYCNECLKKINQLNMYEIVHSFGRFLVENNKKSHEIEDSKEKELYGCVIMTKEEIKLFIDNITNDFELPYRMEIYIHEILHYLSIEGDDGIARIGLMFDSLAEFEHLKETY